MSAMSICVTLFTLGLWISCVSATEREEPGRVDTHTLSDTLVKLEERLTAKFESRIDEIQSKYESENTVLRQKVKQLEEQLARGNGKRGVNNYDGNGVAFQSTLSGDKEHLSLGQTIVFNHVITNLGGAYNSSNGMFTCPVPGVYVFHMDIVAGSSDYVEAEFNVNGQNKNVNVLSDKTGDTIWDQGAASIVLQLSGGDMVSIKIHWPQAGNTLHGNSYCSFSGFLLMEMEPTPVKQVIG